MRRVLYVVILFMIAASSSAQEYSVLNVVSAWGGRTAFNTADVKKIIFTEGELILLDSDEESYFFSTSDLLSLNFRNYPGQSLVSTDENILEGVIKLYPNPAGDVLHIDPGLSEHESVCVDIISVNGQTLGTGRISKVERSIDVSELSPGIYLCIVYSTRKVSIMKFIKQERGRR